MKAFRLMGVHQPESFYFALSSGERFVMHYRYLNLRGSILQEAGLHPSGGGAPSFRKRGSILQEAFLH